MSKILLVCTGNTCRSPMAEAMLKAMARRSGVPVEVRSAGVSTVDGMPVSAHAASTLRSRNYEVPGPSSRLTRGDVGWADLVLTMTSGHKMSLVQQYPEAVGKTHTLKEYALADDPVMEQVAEAERLYTEWQVRHSLGEPVSEADRLRLLELQRRLPSFDVADPFGGSLGQYGQCADELEEALRRVVKKLADEDGPAGAD